MKKKPSDFELQILSVLWENHPLTVREVRERLPDDKPRAYTSVLSVMQVMEKKGFLGRTRAESGNADVWHAVVEQQSVTQPLMQRLMEQVFGGKPSAVMQQLLQPGKVDESELKQIRKLLSDYEKTEKKDPKP